MIPIIIPIPIPSIISIPIKIYNTVLGAGSVGNATDWLIGIGPNGAIVQGMRRISRSGKSRTHCVARKELTPLE